MYSDTAAQNYPDPELFQRMANMLPAKRCGTTAEVRAMVPFFPLLIGFGQLYLWKRTRTELLIEVTAE